MILWVVIASVVYSVIGYGFANMAKEQGATPGEAAACGGAWIVLMFIIGLGEVADALRKQDE